MSQILKHSSENVNKSQVEISAIYNEILGVHLQNLGLDMGKVIGITTKTDEQTFWVKGIAIVTLAVASINLGEAYYSDVGLKVK
jgi:TctA family transporter